MGEYRKGRQRPASRPMELWAFTTLLLANCLVSAAVGYWAAGKRFSLLAFKVAEMEAAVASYWDRIRKRMRVEPNEAESGKPSLHPDLAAQQLTPDQVYELAQRQGLTFNAFAKRLSHSGS